MEVPPLVVVLGTATCDAQFQILDVPDASNLSSDPYANLCASPPDGGRLPQGCPGPDAGIPGEDAAVVGQCVYVLEGASIPEEPGTDAVTIQVSQTGYEPATISGVAGKTVSVCPVPPYVQPTYTVTLDPANDDAGAPDGS
jgi:hypothetical protein